MTYHSSLFNQYPGNTLENGTCCRDIQGFRSPGFEASPPLGSVLRCVWR